MQKRLEHPRGIAAGGTVAAATQTATVGVATRRKSSSAGEGVRMFGDLDPEVRLRMELLVRASASPETALPHVIALLVEGDEARAAINEANPDGSDFKTYATGIRNPVGMALYPGTDQPGGCRPFKFSKHNDSPLP